MPISQTAVRRPIATVMFFVAVVLLGVISLQQLAVDLLKKNNQWANFFLTKRYQPFIFFTNNSTHKPGNLENENTHRQYYACFENSFF